MQILESCLHTTTGQHKTIRITKVLKLSVYHFNMEILSHSNRAAIVLVKWLLTAVAKRTSCSVPTPGGHAGLQATRQANVSNQHDWVSNAINVLRGGESDWECNQRGEMKLQVTDHKVTSHYYTNVISAILVEMKTNLWVSHLIIDLYLNVVT